MTATLRQDAGPGTATGTATAERVAALHRRIAQVELERVWHEAGRAGGHWCLRRGRRGWRCRPGLGHRTGRPVGAHGRRRDPVRGAGDDPDVVHYRNPARRASRCGGGEALGRRGTRLGLAAARAWRPIRGPAPPSDPGTTERHPELTLAALVAAMSGGGGVPALDGPPGHAGWTASRLRCGALPGGGRPADVPGADDVPGDRSVRRPRHSGWSADAEGSGLAAA